MSYTYKISFEFEHLSDKGIIEERIKAFNFNINKITEQKKRVVYTLERPYFAELGLFQLLCTQETAKIIDSDDEEIITREDVVSFKSVFSAAVVSVTDQCFERFVYQNNSQKSVYFSLGGNKVHSIYVLEDDGSNTITFRIHDFEHKTISPEKKAFITSIINIVTEPLKGIVTVNILEENAEIK